MIKVEMKKIPILILVFFLISPILVTASTNYIENIYIYDKSNSNILEKNDFYFDLKMRINMFKARIPSLVACIIKNNSVVWNNGYGIYNRLFLKRPDNTTIYMMGSVSKCITATAFMRLYEQGKFNLSDNVSKFLPFDLKNPNFPNINITMDMMLSHRSSIYDHTFFPKNPFAFFLKLVTFSPP